MGESGAVLGTRFFEYIGCELCERLRVQACELLEQGFALLTLQHSSGKLYMQELFAVRLTLFSCKKGNISKHNFSGPDIAFCKHTSSTTNAITHRFNFNQLPHIKLCT